MNIRFLTLGVLSLFLVCISCKEDELQISKSEMYFKKVDSAVSGISFSNNIKETNQINYFSFEYIFNGGGVAVGDINNDGLDDIYFSSNQNENKLYLNKGNLKFEDITEQAGVAAANGWKTGVNMIDINRDGLLDIYVCRSGWKGTEEANRKNLLYINNGNLTFVEAAKEFGLDESSYSVHSTFFDYDKDGDLDCYITSHPTVYKLSVQKRIEYRSNPPKEAEDKFYENVNGKYIDITAKSKLKNYGHGLGLVSADINKDGAVDIYVANDYRAPDFYYENQNDGTFKNELDERIGHISYNAMGVDVADINNDGYEDIFVSEMLPTDYKRSKTNMASMNVEEFELMQEYGFHNQYMHNTLQLSRRGTYFSEIAQIAGVHKSDWSWGCIMEDFDNDGKRDIYIANGNKRDYLNKDYSQKSNEALGGKSVEIDDVNRIFKSFKPNNFIFRNKGNYQFEDVTETATNLRATNSQAFATSDFDGDGDLDIIINNLDEEATLLENKLINSNYINIDLVAKVPGGDLNAKVTIHSDLGMQYYETKNVRGYQSKSTDIVHFGLRKDTEIDEVRVEWIDGTVSTISNVASNQVLTISQKEANGKSSPTRKKETTKYHFEDKKLINPSHVSRELKFDDYKNQVLLPQRYSRLGPFISKGDVNGDGLLDIYIGGPKGQSGALYIHTEGSYKLIKVKAFEDTKEYEDMGSEFVDFDGDGDLDLYVVSGGNEYAAKSHYYIDRLYINDGHGKFVLSSGIIPSIPTSGSCVISSDIDGDGDIDLFVGGRLFPDHYPQVTPSMLLVNENYIYKDIAQHQGNGLNTIGMVTDAVFADIDSDGDDDLVIVGEWMGIVVMENNDGVYSRVDKYSTLELENKGWWKTIEASDLDNDGDIDFVVGNKGLNHKYKASIDNPLAVYAGDFDNSGTYDVFLAKNIGDRVVPVRGKECSSQQMPSLLQKYESYESFADAKIEDILNLDSKDADLFVNQFSSLIIKNTASGLRAITLDRIAQFSEANAIICMDINNDGLQDILIAGNNHDTEVETSRSDASIGTIMINRGNMKFEPLSDQETDLSMKGNVRDLIEINKQLFCAINNGEFATYVLKH